MNYSRYLILPPLLLASLLTTTAEQAAVGTESEVRPAERLSSVRSELQALTRQSRQTVDRTERSVPRVAQYWRNY